MATKAEMGRNIPTNLPAGGIFRGHWKGSGASVGPALRMLHASDASAQTATEERQGCYVMRCMCSPCMCSSMHAIVCGIGFYGAGAWTMKQEGLGWGGVPCGAFPYP